MKTKPNLPQQSNDFSYVVEEVSTLQGTEVPVKQLVIDESSTLELEVTDVLPEA